MTITSIAFNAPELTPMCKKFWRLTKPLRATINMPAGKGYRIAIDEGFLTDLRSGSDLLNPIVPKWGDWGTCVAYIVHDALYTRHFMSRQLADELLRDMLVEAGMGKFKAALAYRAVRMFGGGAWNASDEHGNKDKVFLEVI